MELDKLPYGVNEGPRSVTLGSSRDWAWGEHEVREGPRKANILAPPWRELSSFPLLSQHCTGVNTGAGIVAKTVQ